MQNDGDLLSVALDVGVLGEGGGGDLETEELIDEIEKLTSRALEETQQWKKVQSSSSQPHHQGSPLEAAAGAQICDENASSSSVDNKATLRSSQAISSTTSNNTFLSALGVKLSSPVIARDFSDDISVET